LWVVEFHDFRLILWVITCPDGVKTLYRSLFSSQGYGGGFSPVFIRIRTVRKDRIYPSLENKKKKKKRQIMENIDLEGGDAFSVTVLPTWREKLPKTPTKRGEHRFLGPSDTCRDPGF